MFWITIYTIYDYYLIHCMAPPQFMIYNDLSEYTFNFFLIVPGKYDV